MPVWTRAVSADVLNGGQTVDGTQSTELLYSVAVYCTGK